MEDIKQIVKQYILDELLPGEDPAQLTDSVQLVKSGVLDSIAKLLCRDKAIPLPAAASAENW